MTPRQRLLMVRIGIILFLALGAFLIVGNIISTKYELAHPAPEARR